MLLRLLVNMNVSVVLFLVCSIASCRAYSLALRMFDYPGNLEVILNCSGSLNTLALAMLPFP